MAAPQFRVVPGTTGGAALTMNDKCLQWLIGVLKEPREGEKPRAKVMREALVARLTDPGCEAQDLDFDPCT